MEERGNYDLSSLKGIVHAAAPCPVEVKRQMIDWVGPILFEYYAGTEGDGLDLPDLRAVAGASGSVGAPSSDPHICDEDGTELPVGEIGLVYSARTGRCSNITATRRRRGDSRHRDHEHWATLRRHRLSR